MKNKIVTHPCDLQWCANELGQILFLLFFLFVHYKNTKNYFHILSLINMTALSCNEVYTMWHQHNRCSTHISYFTIRKSLFY